MDERQYRSLYRTYRPQTPDQVLGQDHVVRALVGALREGRLSHAFLFCGPRGTGKTSTARILAKMVNCEHGPTAEPCGVCEQCVAIREGVHLDVSEIDAASHGGVDDARELRERAPTAPVQGREKVYIIDEAQRLSREAFDALLKLFEEPPPGVRFVLATTEPHKMPATIVGRCQRFDFRRLPADLLAEHLGRVATAEKIALSPEAAHAIARNAEGSARDALSLLDQAAVLGSGTVDEATVSSLVGEAQVDVRFELADAVAAGNPRVVFGIVHRLVQEGHDLRDATAQAIAHFRDLLLALVAPDQHDLIDVPPEHHARLVAQAGKFTPSELDRILSLLLEANTNLRWTTSPRLTLELALVQAALPEADPRAAGMLSRLERLERLSGVETGPQPRRSGSADSGPAPEAGGGPDDGTAEAPGASIAPAPVAEPEGNGRPRSPTRTRRAKDPEKQGAEAAERGEAAGAPEAAGVPDAAATEPASTPEAVAEPARQAAPAPHAPTTDAVDSDLVRRAWPDVVKALDVPSHRVLHTIAQLVVAQNLDGEILELVFPAGKAFAAAKVDQKQKDLQEVLRGVLGISPRIRCVVREGPPGFDPDVPEDEPAPTPEMAVERVIEGLGAEVVEE